MKRITALLSMLAMSALACNLLSSTVEDLGATAEAAISDSDLVGEITGEMTQAAPEGLGGPESLDLDAPLTYNEPVDQIDSYRIAMELAFEAESGERGSVTGTGARTLDPLAMSMQFEAFDNAAQPGELPFAFSMTESTVTVSSPTLGCASLAAGDRQDPFTLLIDLGGFLTGQAQRVRPDQEVNGVPVYRFALDSSNVKPGELEIADLADGTIYIAKSGGYIVRMEMTGTGTSEMLSGDPDLNGQISYSLDYYDFNQPLEITPPEGCDQAAAEVNYPVTDDAYQLSSLLGIVSYKTNLPLEEVVQFYKDEMPAAGWTLDEEFSAGPLTLLSFSGASGSVQVTLSYDANSGTVDVGILELG